MNNKLFTPIDIKTKLSTLWIFVLIAMIYADIIGFLSPGTLEAMMTGDVGIDLTPTVLVIISFVQMIPISMILFSRILQDRPNRWLNIFAGAFTILYVTAGGSWDKPSYIVFATIEIIAMLTIIWSAWNWTPTKQTAASSTYPTSTNSGL